jgi:hypothetical protein
MEQGRVKQQVKSKYLTFEGDATPGFTLKEPIPKMKKKNGFEVAKSI